MRSLGRGLLGICAASPSPRIYGWVVGFPELKHGDSPVRRVSLRVTLASSSSPKMETPSEMRKLHKNLCKTWLYLHTGWWLTYPSEKYEFVSWDDYSQYMENLSKCSKPPTSIYCHISTLHNPHNWSCSWVYLCLVIPYNSCFYHIPITCWLYS